MGPSWSQDGGRSTLQKVVYRDDRQALALQLDALERENAELRRTITELEQRAVQSDRYESQSEGGKLGPEGRCVACGGTLLPIAMFAGHNLGDPQPIHMSTLRFRSRGGGFTHAAPVHSKACSSCGYIHNYVEFGRDEQALADDETAMDDNPDAQRVPNGASK